MHTADGKQYCSSKPHLTYYIQRPVPLAGILVWSPDPSNGSSRVLEREKANRKKGEMELPVLCPSLVTPPIIALLGRSILEGLGTRLGIYTSKQPSWRCGQGKASPETGRGDHSKNNGVGRGDGNGGRRSAQDSKTVPF